MAISVDHAAFVPARPQLMKSRSRLFNKLLVCILLGLSCLLWFTWETSHQTPDSRRSLVDREGILQTCAALKVPAGPLADFHSRKVSDRFQPGINPTLIRNATVWTGEGNGTVVLLGDILLNNGIIQAVGHIPSEITPETRVIDVYDAEGAWITPGLGGS